MISAFLLKVEFSFYTYNCIRFSPSISKSCCLKSDCSSSITAKASNKLSRIDSMLLLLISDRLSRADTIQLCTRRPYWRLLFASIWLLDSSEHSVIKLHRQYKPYKCAFLNPISMWLETDLIDMISLVI